MDLKVLQFKNKKLAERLEQRQACEDELRERIEKLEKRQATDDATLLIVNRYWAQVDAPLPSRLALIQLPFSDSCWEAELPGKHLGIHNIFGAFSFQLDETVETLLRHHENQGELSSGTEAPGTQEGPTRDETPLTEPGTSELRGRARARGPGKGPGEEGTLDIRLLESLPSPPPPMGT